MTRLIVALVTFTISGGVFFIYTKPTYDNLQSTRDQITQYNTALDKAAELQQLKQTLLSRYNAFSTTDLDRLQKLLPDHVDNVRLILDLDNLAQHYGLAMQNVDVSSSPVTGAQGQNHAALGTIGGSDNKYDSLMIKFSTSSSYPTFVQFLADLERSLRIVDVFSISLSASKSTSASPVTNGSGDTIYQYDITLRTYWLK
jgi:Tfp pilus assembly protein PilO